MMDLISKKKGNPKNRSEQKKLPRERMCEILNQGGLHNIL